MMAWDSDPEIGSIVSNFTSYSKNFMKLNNIILCSKQSKYYTIASVPWWSDTKSMKIRSAGSHLDDNNKRLSSLRLIHYLEILGCSIKAR